MEGTTTEKQEKKVHAFLIGLKASRITCYSAIVLSLAFLILYLTTKITVFLTLEYVMFLMIAVGAVAMVIFVQLVKRTCKNAGIEITDERKGPNKPND